MSSAEIKSVDEFTTLIQQLLAKAREVKPYGGLEPAVTIHYIGDGLNEIRRRSQDAISRDYAAVETACRNIFYDLVASKLIQDPGFSEVWNLLDVLSVLSDLEQCEPSLLFWLVEELLDTQTIDGCRAIFDYLDSRRESITAKHFKQKQLIILRACNELLRRLSRAEDTVFCGRVFIFLFQSFPLGDRSSVNLRGEYHTENITVFENLPSLAQFGIENGMDVDHEHRPKDNTNYDTNVTEPGSTAPLGEPSKDTMISSPSAMKITSSEVKDETKNVKTASHHESPPDLDTLYPIFWSLQESFSAPTRLFDDATLEFLKSGLDLTMRKFKDVHQEPSTRTPSRLSEESKRGAKRKRNGQEDELTASFNPKYLTSRDLFDLEINDLAFRRHILVQALILIDFLLSLTSKAKKKLEKTTNKSVLYNYTLNEENTKWAVNTRNEIAVYLQQGPEGKFYYRMVDTVLSRDKNWVHWKAEGCPLIQRDPISSEDFAAAEKGAAAACANKRLRTTPLGTLDLSFLSDTGDSDGLEKLKDPERYFVPTAESFQRPIADDEFEMEMAKDDVEKRAAADARASKLWRTLRIASKSKLSLFDKIDDGNNLKALFESPVDDNKGKMDDQGLDENSDQTDKATDGRVAEEQLLDETRVEMQQEIAVN